MAEAIATGLAVEAAKAATKLVTTRVLEEATLFCGFKDQFMKLQEKFSDIQTFLEDLGSAKYVEKSKFVNLWLNKFTDLAYSADELMDDYEYELLRRKIELKNNHPSFKKKCSNFLSPATNPAIFRIRMSHRVRNILSKFDELHKEARVNGIQLGQLAREAVASTSVGYYVGNEALHQNRKHAVARGSEFIGRKSDEEKLLQMILNPTREGVDRLSTVAIVGIGGLGKTSIARRLYQHEDVDAHFGKKIWICVSEDFKVARLLNEMVEHLTSSKCDLTNTGAITNKLEEELKGKKFFLVLDDVWENNQDSWNSFQNELLSIGDLPGIVILITTRSVEVADKARAFYQHKLLGLSENEGWALLQQTVFSDTRPYGSSFDNVGRKIVNRCKGVPLAIKAIGGTLQSKKHAYDEWELVENSELWGFLPEDISDVLPSLLLSYNHLNHVYVKQCFAYCALFPKGFGMEKHILITLWSAQGLLHDYATSNAATSTMELVGEKYINILLNHSFLNEEKTGNGRIFYTMHDLVHDLASYVIKKELLVWKGGNKRADVSHLRHLEFILAKNESPPDTFNQSLTTRKLRTLCFWGKDNQLPCWISSISCARYMRTLILHRTSLTEVPHIIGQLVHLRFLDLSYNDIRELPESICKLYQLQTLIMYGNRYLRELPKELHRLKNLRHIERTYYLFAASRRIRQLTNLQSLPPLQLRDGGGWTIDELGPLDQVKGNMVIGGLEHVKNKEAATQVGLGRKDKILYLCLHWRVGKEVTTSPVSSDVDVLDSLEPHPNLQRLVADGFMGMRFPLWMRTMVVNRGNHSTPFKNLLNVRLVRCSRCIQLPTLGHLPLLSNLWLEGFDDLEYIGEEFYHATGTAKEKVLFPSLMKLRIICFERLKTWIPALATDGETAFPKLETLVIVKCPQLETVPAFNFHSVKHLTLEYVGGSQPLDIIKYSHALTSLQVEGMEKLMIIPQELSNCTNLQKLHMKKCDNVECIPNGLISLEELKIVKCRSLTCIPDGLSSLRHLEVWECEGLERLPISLEESTFLEILAIRKCPLIKGPIPDFGRLHNGLRLLESVSSGEFMSSSLHWIPNFHHLLALVIGGDSRDEWKFNLTYPCRVL